MARLEKKAAGAPKRDAGAGIAARKARCVAVADAGVKSARDFASLMSSLIGDIAANRIDTRTANAICNAGGKLLRVAELQSKYGKPTAKDQGLMLIP